MILKDNLHINYDLSGNLILTIPKFYINNIDQNTLLKSIERLIRSSTTKINISNGWEGDSAADIVCICKSNVNDGSISHDQYIYGLE